MCFGSYAFKTKIFPLWLQDESSNLARNFIQLFYILSKTQTNQRTIFIFIIIIYGCVGCAFDAITKLTEVNVSSYVDIFNKVTKWTSFMQWILLPFPCLFGQTQSPWKMFIKININSNKDSTDWLCNFIFKRFSKSWPLNDSNCNCWICAAHSLRLSEFALFKWFTFFARLIALVHPM